MALTQSLRFVQEGPLEYLGVDAVEVALVLPVQAPPVLLVPFDLQLRFVFANLGSVGKSGEILPHELGEVLVLPLPLSVLLRLRAELPLLLLRFPLIGSD